MKLKYSAHVEGWAGAAYEVGAVSRESIGALEMIESALDARTHDYTQLSSVNRFNRFTRDSPAVCL